MSFFILSLFSHGLSYNRDMKRYLIIFKGQVQGVGFRYTACMVAGKLNLTGYVENLNNGDVRAEVQGEKEAINSFIGQMLNNPNRWIRIEDYSLREIELEEDETSFKERY